MGYKPLIPAKEMSIKEHLKELEQKFKWVFISTIILFFTFFFIAEDIIEYLIKFSGISKNNLVTLSPLEGINTYLSISLTFTFICIMPLIILSIYRFVKPAIPPARLIGVRKYLVGSFVIAIVGMFSGVIIFSKFLLGTLTSGYGVVEAMWSIKSLIGFILTCSFGMAIVMQTIIIIPFLNKIGLIDIKRLRSYRPFIFIMIIVSSALLTPPDVISQLFMAVPFYMSYEVGMFLTKFQEVQKC